MIQEAVLYNFNCCDKLTPAKRIEIDERATQVVFQLNIKGPYKDRLIILNFPQCSVLGKRKLFVEIEIRSAENETFLVNRCVKKEKDFVPVSMRFISPIVHISQQKPTPFLRPVKITLPCVEKNLSTYSDITPQNDETLFVGRNSCILECFTFSGKAIIANKQRKIVSKCVDVLVIG